MSATATNADAATDAIIDVRDLKTVFNTQDGTVHAVNGVSFSVARGELLGVVGESGSGKSVTMMSLLQLLPSPPAEVLGGRALFDGTDLLTLDTEALRHIRGGRIGFIFQDPMTSLNPVFTVGFQLIEPLRIHRNMSRRQARERAAELLETVGIPSPKQRLNDYPHQFSGGMRQRVMIAIALACEPQLLIADEPTTALDVTVQAQIIELIKSLRRDRGTGIVWITHDLGVVAGLADRVAVMYGGLIVEQAPVRALYQRPQHPYTRALLETLPDTRAAARGEPRGRLRSIGGQPPNLKAHPSACPFAPRCQHALERCWRENPLLQPADPADAEHLVACWWDPQSDRERAL